MLERNVELLTFGNQQAYCLQCETGREAKVADLINLSSEGVTALVPQQEQHRSNQGKRNLVRSNLLPGYVFVYANSPLPFREILSNHYVYRFLNYGNGDSFALRGNDRDFAAWVFVNHGVLVCSKAISLGTKLKIVAGPLKEHIGVVEKVDRHNRNVCLSIQFDNAKRIIWMPFEWVDSNQILSKPFAQDNGVVV